MTNSMIYSKGVSFLFSFLLLCANMVYTQVVPQDRLVSWALVESMDPAVFSILTNPEYKLPTVLPDGTYRQ